MGMVAAAVIVVPAVIIIARYEPPDALVIFETEFIPFVKQNQGISIAWESAQRFGNTGFILRKVVLQSEDNQINKIDSLTIDTDNLKPGGRVRRFSVRVEGLSPDPATQQIFRSFLGGATVTVNYIASLAISDDGVLDLQDMALEVPGLARLRIQGAIAGLPPIGRTLSDIDVNGFISPPCGNNL
jgi:hypothetical protein